MLKMAKEDLKKQIEEADAAVKTAKEALEKAKTADLDTADLESELKEAEETLEKLKKAYGG